MKNKKPEANFQRNVIDALHLHGWKVAHFRKAQMPNGRWITPFAADGKGFPDLFAVNEKMRDRLAAECKVPPNTVEKEQDTWLEAMERCGIPAYVWTPMDWDEIEGVARYGTSWTPDQN